MNKFKVYKFINEKKMTPSLDTVCRVGGVIVSGIRASRIRFELANQVGPETGRHISPQVKALVFFVIHICPTVKDHKSVGRHVKPALRWGVAFVGVISTGHGSPFMGKTFHVQDRHRWITLIRGRNCEEGRHVALIFIL